jgi:hypothetical protein
MELNYNYIYIQLNALFYYLKLKNYLQYIALIHYKLSLVFKILPDMFRRQSRAIFRGVFKPNLLA